VDAVKNDRARKELMLIGAKWAKKPFEGSKVAMLENEDEEEVKSRKMKENSLIKGED